MFSKDLEHSIGQCYKRAREARHEFMTVEHLLLALLDNTSGEAVLKAVGADFARLRRELEEAIEVSVNKLAEDDGRDTQPTRRRREPAGQLHVAVAHAPVIDRPGEDPHRHAVMAKVHGHVAAVGSGDLGDPGG